MGLLGNKAGSFWENKHCERIGDSILYLESCKKEIIDFWDDDDIPIVDDHSDYFCIEKIIKKFHRVAISLKTRYNNRNTIEISDEYDVQDLFGALLKINFDDVRAEEYSPSYDGGVSRIDFLVKDQKFAIEIKMARQSLKDRTLGGELIDSQRYQKYPDCDHLICFVYDPEPLLKNPNILVGDLSKEYDDFQLWYILN